MSEFNKAEGCILQPIIVKVSERKKVFFVFFADGFNSADETHLPKKTWPAGVHSRRESCELISPDHQSTHKTESPVDNQINILLTYQYSANQ